MVYSKFTNLLNDLPKIVVKTTKRSYFGLGRATLNSLIIVLHFID